MATTQKLSTELESNFDGGFMRAKWLKGGIRTLKTKALRNALPYLYRWLDGSESTIVFIESESKFYRLINNPINSSTTDADWEIVVIGGISTFSPIGNWNSNNTSPVLSDAGAVNINGNFYFVSDTPTPTDVTIPGLFGGLTTSVVNGNLIVSVGNQWVVVANSTAWESISKPQVIVDYVNGTVIAHQHTSSDITDLSDILGNYVPINRISSSSDEFDDVTDTDLLDLSFIKRYYYDKDSINLLLGDLSGDGVSQFIQLIDTPSNYTGKAGKWVQVSGDEDGLIFSDLPPITLESVLAVGNDAGAQEIVNVADPTTAQSADTKAARDAAITSAVNQIRNGASASYDTLKEIEDELVAIKAIVGGAGPDGDTIVNTVAELLSIFSTYTEGVDVVTLFASKVNTSDVYNALDQLVAGKVLDARQGKVLNDLISALTTTVGTKLTGTRATDAETQITGVVSEDDKFVSRLKLFNWWTWVKTQAQVFTNAITARQFASTFITLTDAATIVWDAANGQNARVTLAGNRTLGAITNPIDGAIYTLRVIQDVTGGRTLAFNAAYLFNSTPPIVSTASQYSILQFIYNGTNFVYLNSHTAADALKANLGANTSLENLSDSSDEYGVTLFSRVGAFFRSSYLKWTESIQRLEIAGSAFLISVGDTITSGNALFSFNNNQDEALIFKDKGSNKFTTYKSTTGSKMAIHHQKQEFNLGLGFGTIEDQKTIVTSTTAATNTVIASIAIPSGYSIELHLRHAMATANNGGAYRQISCSSHKTFGQNVGGTTTGFNTAITAIYGGGTSTGGFNINFDDTTDVLQIRFLNETGTGYEYEPNIEFSYILKALPS